jgi:hypothetical protein
LTSRYHHDRKAAWALLLALEWVIPTSFSDVTLVSAPPGRRRLILCLPEKAAQLELARCKKVYDKREVQKKALLGSVSVDATCGKRASAFLQTKFLVGMLV